MVSRLQELLALTEANTAFAKASRLANRLFDADSSYGEIVDGLMDHDVPEDIAKQVAADMGRVSEGAPVNKMYGMDAPTDREKLISKIEGYTGTLESMPYHKVSLADLKAICDALCKTNESLNESARPRAGVIIGSEDRKDGTYYEIVEMGATYYVPREWVGGSQKVGSTGMLKWSDKKDQRGWHFSPE